MLAIRGDKETEMEVDVEVAVDIGSYFGSFKWVSKSVQVLVNGIESVMVLTLRILKYRSLKCRADLVWVTTKSSRSYRNQPKPTVRRILKNMIIQGFILGTYNRVGSGWYRVGSGRSR